MVENFYDFEIFSLLNGFESRILLIENKGICYVSKFLKI